MNKLALMQAIVSQCRPPWTVVADRLGWLQPGRAYPVRYGGACFEARGGVGDFAVLNEIFLHRSYDVALRRLAPGGRVIDIGANIGAFAVAAVRAGAAEVHAFEPLAANLEMVRRNLRLNGLEGCVHCDPRAVSETGETATFYFNPADAGGGTFFPGIHDAWRGGRGPRTVEVACTRLPDILHSLKGPCDLLKMDCEGAEYGIVKSLGDRHERVRAVVFEFHSDGKLDATLELLRRYGFSRIERAEPYQVIYASR
jgi:FkbM family methyltransferase